jgi:hypothetical protein
MYMVKKDKTTEEENWDVLLRDYGFGYLDEFDLALANVIETGYVDEEYLSEEAIKMNKKIIAGNSKKSLNDAWDLFFNTFEDNEAEVIVALENALNENAEYIGPVELDSTVRLLSDLGKEKMASNLIDVYIEKNCNNVRLFDLDNSLFSDNINDKELISKFNLKYNEVMYRSRFSGHKFFLSRPGD